MWSGGTERRRPNDAERRGESSAERHVGERLPQGRRVGAVGPVTTTESNRRSARSPRPRTSVALRANPSGSVSQLRTAPVDAVGAVPGVRAGCSRRGRLWANMAPGTPSVAAGPVTLSEARADGSAERRPELLQHGGVPESGPAASTSDRAPGDRPPWPPARVAALRAPTCARCIHTASSSLPWREATG